ncbi:type II toxin-antitoxin system RelE/ParE family toxin [Methylovirgula sp. HY1]|uniref:type II toxin-antitoxin system RelE family toxin n=1 Tax=Methylovirgula sp. HY1 TaxID=2822761 RepID=UPI001C5A61ED|nr:type II toxin-antitoxin system RelE/ParE family toxin [Methylovirgula sp. HY1]QXX73234.1 Toxin RelG [Methylovirgula sp. HY1]
MTWQIEFDAAALDDLRKLGSAGRVHVLRFLQERIAPADDPRRLGKALSGDKPGFWRYRVGDYRIIARIEDQRLMVLIIAIGHRSEIYRK